MIKTTVLALPGTGHPHGGDGITEHFLSHFDTDRYTTRIVSYPASFGQQGVTFEESRIIGHRALITALADLDGAPAILAGYSQGAVIAGDVSRDIALSRSTQYNVRAVALIADGLRPQGIGVVPTGDPHGVAEGYGIMGQRPIPDDIFPTFWASAWGDPISALPPGNPLRTVADLAGWFSIDSPAAIWEWGAHMLNRAVSGRMQAWWNPVHWHRWNSAIAFSRGYLFDYRHTNDYIRYGYNRALADAVDRHVQG